MLDIKNRQNSPEILDLLFLQRIYCEKTERKTILIYLLTFFIPILGFLAKDCYYFLILNSFFIFFSNVLILNRKKEILLATTIKEMIDRELFKLNFEDRDLDFSKEDIQILFNEERNKKFERYKKEINNNGTNKYRGVRDWYSCDNSLGDKKEILNCQKQNVYFTKDLSKKFIISLILMTIIISIIFLITLKNNTLETLIVYYLYPFITFIILIYNDYLNYKDFKNILKKLEKEFYKTDKKKIEEKDLKRVQNLIFLYRQAEYRPPLEIFHKFFSRHLHNNWDKIKSRF